MTPPLFFLLGPTAAGKTPLAVALTQRFPFEIISVDSVMIYRGMDMGSAKPDAATLTLAPHHLIDILDPAESYSAGQFREDALHLIAAIHARGRIPLLVGGTMLYFRVLQQGIADLPKAEPTYRLAIEKEAEKHGWPYLHAKLATQDPAAAARIHVNDAQRIQRALEVCYLTGQTLTTLQQAATHPLAHYAVHAFAIAPQDRAVLHARIAKRLQVMLDQGWLAEVEVLYQRGDLTAMHPAVRAVGYRQIWRYLAGELSLEEMKAAVLAATRQLAKRQLTWLRSWPDLTWFDSEDPALLATVSEWIAASLSQTTPPLSPPTH